MKKNNLIRFAQSLAILPSMAMPVILGDIQNTGIYPNVLISQINIEANGTLALNQAVDSKVELQKTRALVIDTYFSLRDMPLEGMGMKMVLEAEKNNLDWRLLPAIAIRESTGGKNACDRVKNNSFGWGSCKIGFNSVEEAIEIVAWNLGGSNPNTAKHYDNKTVIQILRAYNPPYVVRRYAEQVMSIMNAIGEADIEITLSTNS